MQIDRYLETGHERRLSGLLSSADYPAEAMPRADSRYRRRRVGSVVPGDDGAQGGVGSEGPAKAREV